MEEFSPISFNTCKDFPIKVPNVKVQPLSLSQRILNI